MITPKQSITMKQNKDFPEFKNRTGKRLCRMCHKIFDRQDAAIFIGYELSPCCASDNHEEYKEN
jgi:hypothetical protein